MVTGNTRSCEKLCLNVFSLGVFKYMASTVCHAKEPIKTNGMVKVVTLTVKVC